MSPFFSTVYDSLSGKAKYVAPIFFLVCLAGCASVTLPIEKSALGIDGVACVGKVDNPPAGLIEVEDEALLHQALGASGAGKLCAGKVFKANQAVTVFRVWNSEKSYTRLGGWWSFALPSGPKETYRFGNSICPSWSKLDRMSSCKVRSGAEIVVGPGQSVSCPQDQTSYPKSAVNQVYIPNDPANNVLFVEGCTAGVDWP